MTVVELPLRRFPRGAMARRPAGRFFSPGVLAVDLPTLPLGRPDLRRLLSGSLGQRRGFQLSATAKTKSQQTHRVASGDGRLATPKGAPGGRVKNARLGCKPVMHKGFRFRPFLPGPGWQRCPKPAKTLGDDRAIRGCQLEREGVGESAERLRPVGRGKSGPRQSVGRKGKGESQSG